jgi:DNA-binding transcriptional regulator GbsR (MarR family)
MIEEFKDMCQDLTTMSEEIAADLRDLPTDYKLAERYAEIDQEVYEMLEWYEKIKNEKNEWMETPP